MSIPNPTPNPAVPGLTQADVAKAIAAAKAKMSAPEKMFEVVYKSKGFELLEDNGKADYERAVSIPESDILEEKPKGKKAKKPE